MDKKIQVVIRKREGVVFEGGCFDVSSVNEIGSFDILVNHANFVSKVFGKLTVHLDKKQKKEFELESGILSARRNLIEVFLGL